MALASHFHVGSLDDRKKAVTDRIRKDVQELMFRTVTNTKQRDAGPGVWKHSLFTVMRNLFTDLGKELIVMLPKNYERKEFVLITVEDAVKDLMIQFSNLGLDAAHAVQSVDHLLEDIHGMIFAKERAIDFLEVYLACMKQGDPELDESCSLGLKPLRKALTKPYFKTTDGMLSSPAPFLTCDEFKDAFFSTSKQKWTLRDIKTLEDCIRSTLAEDLLRRVRVRHDSLMTDCYEIHEKALDEERIRKFNAGSDEEEEPAPKRGPGRAKKNPVFAQVHPHLFTTADGIKVTYTTDNAQIAEWLKKESDKINRMKYNVICAVYGATVDNIDWSVVSSKIMLETKKLRDASDCRLGYKFSADPTLNTKRLSPHSKHIVDEMARDKNNSWADISAAVGRDEFRTFFYWRNSTKSEKTFKYSWTPEKDAKLCKLAIENQGNWVKVAAEIDEHANKKLVIERFKKTKNPLLRFGKVTRVEDCLLMLTIEKLKGHLKQENHFGELTAYLPWRYESSWRDRAENLFAEYIVPWTLEEDQQLLELAKTMKRDWSKIAKMFNSFKTRKGCLTRFKILEKSEKKHKSLESYHIAYSMVRYNVRKFSHLKEVVTLLQKVVVEPRLPFKGLERNRPPTESELQDFLLAFDKNIMASAIKSMEKYIEFRDEYWKCYNEQNGITTGEKKRTHDRRTFHRENSQSVASALHIRGIKLRKDLAESNTLTSFEKDIYKFYAQFCSTKALRKGKVRPYIPVVAQLIRMPEIQRILRLNRSQQRLLNNPFNDSANEIPVQRGRGRPRKSIFLENLALVPKKQQIVKKIRKVTVNTRKAVKNTMKGVKNTRKGVKDARKVAKNTGKDVKNIRKVVQNTGKAVKNTRKVVKNTGKVMKKSTKVENYTKNIENTGHVEKNTENVEKNTENVQKNTGNVENNGNKKNTGNVKKSTENVEKNTGNVENNGIVKNTRKVVKNTGKVVKNTGKAVKNTGKVVKNTGNVVKNTRKGAKNTGRVMKKTTKVEKSTKNVKNTESVEKSTENVAKNTENIESTGNDEQNTVSVENTGNFDTGSVENTGNVKNTRKVMKKPRKVVKKSTAVVKKSRKVGKNTGKVVKKPRKPSTVTASTDRVSSLRSGTVKLMDSS